MTALQIDYKTRARNLVTLIKVRNKVIEEGLIFIEMFDEHFPPCGEVILHPIRYFIKTFFIDLLLFLISTPGLLWNFRSHWTKSGLYLCMNMAAIVLLVTRLEFCSTEYLETRELFEERVMVIKYHPFHETINVTLSALSEIQVYDKQEKMRGEKDLFEDIYLMFINFIKLFYYKHE